MMFPHEMTLYHKTKDENGTECWSRSVVKRILWEDLRGRIMRKTGTDSSNKAVVYIPMEEGGRVRSLDIADGDVIVKGIYDKEVVRSTRELENALLVTAVETFDFGDDMKSWVVTAK